MSAAHARSRASCSTAPAPRRRSRGGRRRPGDRLGGEGSSAGSPAGPSPVGATFRSSDDEALPSMPDLKVGPTGGGLTGGGPTGDVGSASEDPGAPRTSNLDPRSSSSDSGNSGGAPSAAPPDLPSE